MKNDQGARPVPGPVRRRRRAGSTRGTASTKWAADCGYKGVQVPSWDARLIDPFPAPPKAATIATSSEASPRPNGIEVTGAFDPPAGPSSSPSTRPMTRPSRALGRPVGARQPQGAAAMGGGADGSWRLPRRRTWGSRRWRVFSGALGLALRLPLAAAAAGLVGRPHSTSWPSAGAPILDHADSCGVDICYEIHPGEDLHDGISFEIVPSSGVGNHARANMLYDPSHYVPAMP